MLVLHFVAVYELLNHVHGERCRWPGYARGRLDPAMLFARLLVTAGSKTSRDHPAMRYRGIARVRILVMSVPVTFLVMVRGLVWGRVLVWLLCDK